ncbi:MAG: hypothetical protein ACI8RD_007076 [Bacillariaceae sp.]|jgi:hypothetical protein
MKDRKRHIKDVDDGKGSHTSRNLNQRAAKLIKLKHDTKTRSSSDNFVDLTRPSLSNGIRKEPFDDLYDGYEIEFDFDDIDQGHYNCRHIPVDITTEEMEAEVEVEAEAEAKTIVDNKVFRCCADCGMEKHPSSFTRKQRSLLSDAVCKACRKGRIQRTCFGCGLDLTKYQFSNDQKKKGAAARCMKCIKNCSIKQTEGKKNNNNKNKNKNNKATIAAEQQQRDCAKCGDRSNLFSKKQRKKGAAARCMNCTKYPPKKQEDGKEQDNRKNDLNKLSQSLPSFSVDRGLGRGIHMTRPAWMKEQQQHQRPDHHQQQQQQQQQDDGPGRGRGTHRTRPAWMTVQDNW